MHSGILTGAGIECRRAIRGLAHAPDFGVVLVLGIALRAPYAAESRLNSRRMRELLGLEFRDFLPDRRRT